MSQSAAETTVARGLLTNTVEVEEPSVLLLVEITKGQGFTFDTDVHNGYRLGGNAKDVVSRREMLRLFNRLLDLFIIRRSEVDGLLNETDFINLFVDFCHTRTGLEKPYLFFIVSKSFIGDKHTIGYGIYRRLKEQTATILDLFLHKIVTGETQTGLQNSFCRFWTLSEENSYVRYPYVGRLKNEGITFLGMQKGKPNVLVKESHEAGALPHSLDIEFEPSDEGFANDNVGLKTSTDPWNQGVQIFNFVKDQVRFILSEEVISTEDLGVLFEISESSVTTLEGAIRILMKLLEDSEHVSNIEVQTKNFKKLIFRLNKILSRSSIHVIFTMFIITKTGRSVGNIFRTTNGNWKTPVEFRNQFGNGTYIGWLFKIVYYLVCCNMNIGSSSEMKNTLYANSREVAPTMEFVLLMFAQLQNTFHYDQSTADTTAEKVSEGVINLAKIRFLFVHNHEISLGKHTIWPGMISSVGLGELDDETRVEDPEESLSERKRKICSYEEDKPTTTAKRGLNISGSFTPTQNGAEKGSKAGSSSSKSGSNSSKGQMPTSSSHSDSI